MNKPPTQLFPLDAAASEVVFAPFHDPMISASIPVEFVPHAGNRAFFENRWCWSVLGWDSCTPEKDAAQLTIACNIELGRFDQLIACLCLAPHVSVCLRVCVDENWSDATPATKGTGVRMEVTQWLRRGQLSAAQMIFRAHANKAAIIQLNWLGLADSALVAHIQKSRLTWNPEWPGLIQPPAEWPEVGFARGLLFDAGDLPRLREKRALPGWRGHFAVLEKKARQCLARNPEHDLGEFLPWSDTRYLRVREQGHEPYFWEGMVLAFVGLINEDRQMIAHALRYLMCMVHTTHWCQSAESRLKGSTWDQRCFLEEMTVTSVSVL